MNKLEEALTRAKTQVPNCVAIGSAAGVDEATVDLVVARWRAMIARRESGEGPLSVRG